MVRAGKGTDNFGQGSHSIYITIGPEFLKCLALSLPTTRGCCVQTENVLALGAAAHEVLGGIKEQAKGDGGVELPHRGSMS